MNSWNEEIAKALAEEEEIKLSPEHWQVIYILRDFYRQHQQIPPLGLLVKLVGKTLGPEKAKSIYLYQLFPESPLKKICKIAGLPKPKHCV